MPVQPTYPGVYVQEISSGVRTIAGVSTSITAFVGRARRGPVNEPVTCFNFGEFSRRSAASGRTGRSPIRSTTSSPTAGPRQ
jgi:phage tail sheath protein FI